MSCRAAAACWLAGLYCCSIVLQCTCTLTYYAQSLMSGWKWNGYCCCCCCLGVVAKLDWPIYLFPPKTLLPPLDYIFMRQCHVITWRHSPTAIPSRGGTSFAISQGINFKQQSLIFIVNVNTARHLSVTNQLRKRPSWCLMNKGDPVLLNLKGCCP